LLVAELVEKHGWVSRSIVWTALDTLRTLTQLEEHLTELVAKHQPRLLLIDEATSVAGWQRVIKRLRDNGTLMRVCTILTGSSAQDLKAGAERMAGRRGQVQHPDRVLLPMAFPLFIQQVPRDRATPSNYLRVGGFPFRVAEFVRAGSAWDELAGFQVFDDAVFYEFSRRRLDRSIAIEVLGRLAAIGCSATSYEGFAKPLSVAKDTARKYLDALGDAFLVATLSSFDTARGRLPQRRTASLSGSIPRWDFSANGCGKLNSRQNPREPSGQSAWSCCGITSHGFLKAFLLPAAFSPGRAPVAMKWISWSSTRAASCGFQSK
jgi:predicted AAA+ superfamily ATPase